MLALLLISATVNNLQIREDGRILSAADTKTFLNAARCTCGATFRVTFDVTTTTGEDGAIAVAHGKRCVDSEERISSACTTLWRGSLSGLRVVDFEVSAADLGCDSESTDALIVLVDPLDDGRWQEVASLELPIDTKPPPAPKKPRVLPGESLAEVVFERPDLEETVRYQVLCEKSGEPAVQPAPEAAFVSTRDLCASGPEVLSRRFVCAEVSGGTDSVTVLGLENGEMYTFYVVTIDDFDNPSSLAEAGTATPAPELDLWEVYRREGGRADGHCFVATAAYGDYDHPQVVLLRGFRDEVLARVAPGLISLYYEHSPPLAAWIAGSEAKRAVARALLWPPTLMAGLLVEAVEWGAGR